MWKQTCTVLLLLATLALSPRLLLAAEPATSGLFARKNLVAWCIVPFDSKKRGPEERAAMLEKLGFAHFAYDYRAEHIPTFDDEIDALKRHHVELSAWWFPTTLNDEAKMTLALFAKHKVTPQLWVTGGGGPTKDADDQRARVVAEAARIRPIAEAAAAVGCKVALYNHGGWFGEPENQIAIIQELKLDNVGIVYNLHHGHDHLSRFPELLRKMKPYLYTLNLNGMVEDGERKGQKILQLSAGDLDLKLLRAIRESGYTGPIGILGHTQDDAEERLQDNLDGLDWLLPQLEGKPAAPKPKMRTPIPKAVAAAPAPATNKPVVEGKFGRALDGRAGGAFVAGRDEFRQYPITVECWAKLGDKSNYNILIANELKSSGTHWELFSMSGSGNFTAYLPGFAPDHCQSNAMICDNEWHHVAMILESERIRLFVDAKLVADQVHKRNEKSTEPGRLAIGSLVDSAIGCGGLVDEVRISRGVRPITAIPDKPWVADEATIALWHLDELVDQKRFEDAGPKKGAAVLGQAEASKPAPSKGPTPGKIEGHWGEDAVGFRWTEADSRDDRFGQVDFGTFFSGSITGAGGPVYKGIVIRVGEQREASVCYDTELVRAAAGWKGFLKFDPARFGVIVPPRIESDATFATPRFPGVSQQEQFANFREANPYGPLPKDVAHYEGLYRHGSRVVIKYTIGPRSNNASTPTTTVLESPWVESRDDVSAITRTLFVSPSTTPIRIVISDGAARVRLAKGSTDATILEQAGLGHVLVIPPHSKPVALKVLIAAPTANEAKFGEMVSASPAPEDLVPLLEPGPSRWGEPLVTVGEVASPQATEPYVVDTISLPFDNPFRALLFCGGHDFFSDGRAAVCTLHGDVWLVGGLDDSLKKVTWQRFATGLFQPLGLKVVNDEVYVVGRDQITRLRDLNGDGEADAYDNFNNDAHVTLNGHEYVTCLERDRAGNFYYVKGNSNSQIIHDGSLLRVSADGSKLDVFATGFRNPNGMGMGPNDEITVAPQEGEWTPASGVFRVHEGGFYGGMMSHHRPVPPTNFEHPLVWFPRLADNSSGGQVWTSSDRWGPLSNHLLHMSYGQCRLRLILRDEGSGTGEKLNNGASIELPLRFTSGIHRGRMNPVDGQLYVTGLKGWTTSAVHDGCFQRVRYTGQALRMPIAMATYQNGVALKFSCDIDRDSAQDPASYRIEGWNYKWSAAYGSPEYRPSAPGQVGRDEIEARSATLVAKDTVFVELPELKPIDQLAISYTMTAANGTNLDQTVILTLNTIPKQVFPENQLYRKAEDPELAKLMESLVPGVDVAEQIDAGRPMTSVQRMITFDHDAEPAAGKARKLTAECWIKVPMTGRYRFFAETSPMIRQADRSTTHMQIDNETTVELPESGLLLSLSRGIHRVVVQHHASLADATHFRLQWESSRFPREAIPANHLFRKPSADHSEVSQKTGLVLFEKLRCANCHQMNSAANDVKLVAFDDQAFLNILKSAPRLDGLRGRFQPRWLADWIREPHRFRPDTTMPAVIPTNDVSTAIDLVAYLSTLGDAPAGLDPLRQEAAEEDSYLEGARLYEGLGCIACHTFRDPSEPDEWQRVSLHFVNAKYLPQGLNDYLRNPGRHHANTRMPDFHLSEPEVRALTEYLRREARGEIESQPFQTGHVEKGRLAFAKLGCANCHATDARGEHAKPNVAAIPRAKSVESGCLAESRHSKSPHFQLRDEERRALRQYITAGDANRSVDLKTRSVDFWIHELRCAACHTRDGKQSAWPEIAAEEGSGKAAESIPQMTWVGEKLQGPWIEKLLKGEIAQKPRPWVKARMPAFPAYATLIAHGMAGEHGVPYEESRPAKLNPAEVELGRQLTTREGLDCRQCHGVGKEQPRGDAETQIALGINFAMTRERLRPEFALRQMLDPSRYDIGSRMPRFAPDLKTTAAKRIEGGDASKQFELLKQYIWSIKDE